MLNKLFTKLCDHTRNISAVYIGAMLISEAKKINQNFYITQWKKLQNDYMSVRNSKWRMQWQVKFRENTSPGVTAVPSL